MFLRLIIRRLALGLFVVWVATVLVFLAFFVAPHNVARLIAGRRASRETVAAIRKSLGLDESVIHQYGDFVLGLLRGDLGYSYYTREPVATILIDRLPVSLSVAAGGVFISVVLGVGTGIVAATRPRSILDRSATFLSLLFYAMPPFLLGLLLVYFLFFRLQMAGAPIFPGGGYFPFAESPVQWARHLILPWLTVALVLAATYARLTRGSLLDALGQDYIRTAYSKGLRERRVVFRHGLRSGLTPVLTQVGIDMGRLMGGVIVTETIFGLPGLGKLAVDSVRTNDLPVLVGIVMVTSTALVVASIVVDLLYAVLDPRVQAR